ncbi:MAG TPA: APC family permease [Longimicrobium sp.]|nr:APC family permease [Longimicrobium sp.]
MRRTLGTGDFIALVIGGTMGVGPLIGPAAVLQYTDGAVGRALAAYLLVGLAALAGALTYAELGAMHPGRGGMYAHIRDAFGDIPAFVSGWTLFFVLAAGEIAMVARAAAGYLGQVAGWSTNGPALVAAGMIALSAFVNAAGTRAAVGVARLGVVVTGTAVVVVGGALVFRGAAAGMDLAPAGTAAPAMGMGWVLGVVAWSYTGWHYASLTAGETRDPDRSFPVGLAAGVAALIAAYLLMTVAYSTLAVTDSAAMPPERGQAAFRAVLGPAGGGVAGVVYAVALFTLVHVVLFASARVTAAMAEDGLFFRGLGVIHPRAGTPARAVWAGAAVAVAAVLARVPDHPATSTCVSLLGWSFVALGALSIFVFRRRFPDAERPFRVPGYPWTPLVFIGAAGGLAFHLASTYPGAGVGAAVVLTTGFVGYSFRVSRRRALAGGFHA